LSMNYPKFNQHLARPFLLSLLPLTVSNPRNHTDRYRQCRGHGSRSSRRILANWYSSRKIHFYFCEVSVLVPYKDMPGQVGKPRQRIMHIASLALNRLPVR
jgi:hypothetical protein